MHGCQEYQRNRVKIMDVITSRLSLWYFWKFTEILNFRKIYNPKRCDMLRQIRPSVRQIPVLCQNKGTQRDAVFAVW